MKRTVLTTMTAALAAVAFVGVVPGAAFAQNGWGGRGDGRGSAPWQRGQNRDRDNRDNRDNRSNKGDWRDLGNIGTWGRQDDKDDRNNRPDRNDRNNRDNRDNRGDWNDRDNRDDRNDWRDRDSQDAQKRQKTKNDWRNLATAAGGVAAVGVLRKDPRIIFAGVAGGLYSLNRYEQDRKSQSQTDRARASVFSQPYIYRDGDRYERRTITQNGERFYRFERP